MASPPPSPAGSDAGSDAMAGVHEQDTLRLLLSTDNHLGYAEKDPVRGDDSFRTFGEVLRLARSERVDMLLLGGDLFHENKPSRRTLYQTMSLLRQHCMGDGAVRFQIVSDQSLNFPNFGVVNYEDPNYNIQLPVFSIHGNHDDPSREAGAGSGTTGGTQTLAALDLLSAANFVNYFGKSERADAVEVFPILVVKGGTRVAIYGLGNMRDERLHRMFAQQKVVFRRPAESPEEWFSIFVVHQNRDDRGRGSKNCLPESFIPDFIDFVLWGHEHECLVEMQESLKGEFYITQPGSSVATSLVEGEAREKRVAVLEINGQSFRMSSKPLTTVRPFKMTEVVLSDVEELDPNDPDVADHIREYLEERVNELVREAEVEMAHREQQLQTPIPEQLRQILVRIRVEHSGFPVLVNQRFGSKFVGKVANTNDILLFYRKKRERISALDKMADTGIKEALKAPIRPARLDTITVEDILGKRMHLPDRKMVFLPEEPLAIALDNYVEKNIPSAIDELVETVLEETQKDLAKREARSTQDIHSAVEKKKEQSDANRLLRLQEEAEEEEAKEAEAAASATEYGEPDRPQATKPRAQPRFSSRFYTEDTSENDAESTQSASAARRFGAARNASASSGTARRVRAAGASSASNDSDFTNESSHSTADRGERAPAPARKPSAKARATHQPASTRKRKAPASASVSSPDPLHATRRAPARSAARKSTANDLFSDEDSEVGRCGGVEASDGDEDYEMEEEEEESEVTQSLPTRWPSAAASAKANSASSGAAARGRKRLRQSAAALSDDDDDEFLGSASTRRHGGATGARLSSAKSRANDEIDLVSSNESEPSPPRGSFKAKRAATTRARPQPKINKLFQKQAASQPPRGKHQAADDIEDDVESDSDFTQLIGATTASAVPPTQQPGNWFRAAAAWHSQTQSEMSQSQTAGGAAKRRKLPLSMMASQSNGSGGSGDTAATPAARKGWGRTRR